MKKIIVLIFLLNTFFVHAQNVYIPDTAFKTALLFNPLINTNMDNEIQVSEAISISRYIDVTNWGIHDLTGIEAFVNLDTLYCSNNHLSSIDLSSNPLLLVILCSNNSISSLNLSNNTALKKLDCSHNNLTNLNLTACTLLTNLTCDDNSLSSIDLSANTGITDLSCNDNLLANLDLTSNYLLTTLYCKNNSLVNLNLANHLALNTVYCDNNQLINLDVSADTSLRNLSCQQNSLSSLNLVSLQNLYSLICRFNMITNLYLPPNAWLYDLNSAYNQLTSLDLSGTHRISYVTCNNNHLIYLNLKNGNNAFLSYINAKNNPQLNCIEVDNPGMVFFVYTVTKDSFAVLSSNCAGIEPIIGNTFNDINANCAFDSSDSTLSHVHIKLYDGSNSLVHQLYSNSNGFFRFNVPIGIYQVVLDTVGVPYTVQCPQPGVDTTVSTSLTDTLNFELRCKGTYDLSVHSIINTGWVFPGQQHTLSVYAGDASQWYNLNCASGIGGTVVITVSGPVTYIGPALGALTPVVSGNVFTYAVSDFGLINNLTAFGILFSTNSFAQSGDSVCITATISSTSGTDANLLNNALNLCYQVVNSLDPNVKESFPNYVNPGFVDYFTYKVNFQNTGTAQAFTIKVIDTLATSLDLNTFEFLGSSHPCTVSISGNVITALFENINLADSTTNEAASHGYFQYRIKPKANQALGTAIKNTAFIYFDFNPAIATNTTVNHFSVVTAAENLVADEISVYPNPSKGLFTLVGYGDTDESLKIYNVLGDVVYQAHLQKNKPSLIDISTKATGIYFLRIENQGRIVLNKKIIIQ